MDMSFNLFTSSIYLGMSIFDVLSMCCMLHMIKSWSYDVYNVQQYEKKRVIFFTLPIANEIISTE